MHHTAAKFVPWLLTNEQKQRSINMCLELREKANEDPTFISRIVTGDESWIYGYEEPTISKSKEVQQRAWPLFFFFSMWRGLFTMNLFLLTLWSTLTSTVMFWDAWEKTCDEKTTTVAQSQLAPSSRQCTPPHTSLKTTEFVTNNMVIVPYPSLLTGLSPLWFHFVSLNETEGTTFWNSVWHPKRIVSGTWQH
jgi:hypothetical protein